MIETSGLKNPDQYVGGWVLDYVNAVKGTRFPASFHMASGLWALTSIIGRRCRLKRPGYDLYPPLSFMLLGDSGVGKSRSMTIAYEQIIKPATEGRDGFFAPPKPNLSERGLLNPWRTCQTKSGLDFIEGAYGFEEARSLLANRVGAETMGQTLIKCLDGGDWYDSTGKWGEFTIHGITIGLIVCSTLGPLRESVTVDDFVDGGFIHRFITLHETARPQDIEEELEDSPALTRLSRDAAKLRNEAPDLMDISKGAESFLRSLASKSEDREYDTASMSGFWNRLPAMSAKLGMGFAISEGSFTVTQEHIIKAERFLRGHVSRPLSRLIFELSHERPIRKLFKLADDLYRSGTKGVDAKECLARVQATSPRQAAERMELMMEMGLAKKKAGKYYHPSVKLSQPEPSEH